MLPPTSRGKVRFVSFTRFCCLVNLLQVFVVIVNPMGEARRSRYREGHSDVMPFGCWERRQEIKRKAKSGKERMRTRSYAVPLFPNLKQRAEVEGAPNVSCPDRQLHHPAEPRRMIEWAVAPRFVPLRVEKLFRCHHLLSVSPDSAQAPAAARWMAG
ncbi:hypothetical protein LZ30DRAFT_56600 [Colletotrichum cereale]|nr:hypothetical protein LZ30DRAFT_56600 [Colletotrichum cereale]